MASFSSMGPTADFRLKPDVSAPGFYITSARNSQRYGSRCDSSSLSSAVQVMAGTSMATPVLAGHMSMVREYFQQGFYPSGTKTAGSSFNPSASLLKAVAIAGAQIMNGIKLSYGQCSFIGRVNLSTTAYFDQGFGRLQLTQILYFANAPNRYLHIPSLTSSAAAANFFDTTITAGATNSYTYCVYPNASVPVTVALVWTDPPSTTVASVNLVNNLDLSVTYNGITVAGNSQTAYFAAAKKSAGFKTTDTRNPVEIVTFPGSRSSSASQMTISVSGASLGSGRTQAYSLVVSGFISQGTCGSGPAVAKPFLPV